MEHTSYWLEQLREPLFPKTLWNKPESKIHGPNLSLIGGYQAHFSIISREYSQLLAISPIINIQLLLSDSLKPIIKKLNLNQLIFYLPANKSGSLSLKAYQTIQELISESMAVYFAGDLSNNSETNLLVEKLISELNNLIFVSSDSLEHLLVNNCNYLNKDRVILFFSQSQLQKWLINSHYPMAFRSDMSLLAFSELIHQITLDYQFYLVIDFEDQLFIAHHGQLYSQKLTADLNLNQANCQIINAIAEQPNDIQQAAISGLFSN